MEIVLLTHERELDRLTNSGQLALAAFPQYCRRVTWSRTQPDLQLQQACETQQALLLFPETEGLFPETEEQAISHQGDELILSQQQIIILDATWQEARKMVRQSPYLQQVQRFTLCGQQSSQYQLRRNQLTDGLCTVECVQAIFLQLNMQAEAEQLQQDFELFNQR